MKSFITSIFISLLYSRLTAGLTIPSSQFIKVISPNSTLVPPNSTNLADDRDETHCSSDYASYGQIHPGSIACVLASYDLFQDPKITTIPQMFPMAFLSSTAPLPDEGNGFRTPWRSTYGELTLHCQHS